MFSSERMFHIWKTTLLFLILLYVPALASKKLPDLDETFGRSFARTDDNILIVSTGKIEQQWRLTDRGLSTIHLKDLINGQEWIRFYDEKLCDWNIPHLTDGRVFVKSIDAMESNDNGFTSDHLQVIVSMEYPQCHTVAEYVIWLYPDSPGIRTFLRFKGQQNFESPDSVSSNAAQIQMFNMDMANIKRRAVSFSKHNGARAGKYQQHPMIKQDIRSGIPSKTENYPFAAFMAFENDHSGLSIIKEAPVIDTPVQGSKWDSELAYSYRTGEYICDNENVVITGAGIAATDVLTSRFRRGWALWTVVSDAGEISFQQAIKRYDRMRYPLTPDVDLFIGANNWGSTDNSQDGWKSSIQASILQELDAADEMGIEVVQIDDGWQAGRWEKEKMSPAKKWSLSKKAYPSGWKSVVQKAQENDIILGFWCDGDDIPTSTLIRHMRKAQFHYVKFDFYHTSTYEQVEHLRQKARTLLNTIEHPVRINWDVTGVRSKDQGMFYGREYGNLWYQNQKQHLPDHVLYRPYRVLQDVWHLSHYVNLHQLQIPIQNVDAAYPPETNADQYNHTYAVAIGLMGCPNFFQELKYLDDDAREEIRAILDIYKKVRPEIVKGYVYPIGDKPDDKSWTGFQCHIEDENKGYVLIFREIGNNQSKAMIPLHFIHGKTLILTDLRTKQKKRTLEVQENGYVEVHIEKPADILFARYKLK